MTNSFTKKLFQAWRGRNNNTQHVLDDSDLSGIEVTDDMLKKVDE